MKTKVFIFCALLVLGGCGTSLVEQAPSAGASFLAAGGSISSEAEIGVDATFTASFTTPVKPSSVNSSTFYIMPSVSAEISSLSEKSIYKKSSSDLSGCDSTLGLSGSYSYTEDHKSFTLTLDEILNPNSSYRICLHPIQFKDSRLDRLFEGLSQGVDTGDPLTDEIAPTISSPDITADNPTTTTMDLEWETATDNETEPENLNYLVYYSATSDLDSIEEIESNGTAVGEYATDLSSKTVTGLIQNTEYTFNVIVKDETGNKAIYDPTIETTERDTSGAPTISSGIITASGETTTSVDLEWTAANDDFDEASNLEYSIYYSESNNLDSVANIELNGTQFGSAEAGITSKTVTGLTESTTYYFNIIVKDYDENQANYTTVSQSTSDETAPTAETGITFDKASVLGVRVNWGVATDDLTSTENLQYKIVKANDSSSIDSVAKADAITGDDIVMDWTANTTSDYAFVATGGTPYFAVLVKDEAGNKEIYTPQQTSAIGDSPNVDMTALSNGNFIVMYRDEADSHYLKSIVFDSTADYVTGPNTITDSSETPFPVAKGECFEMTPIRGTQLTNGDVIISVVREDRITNACIGGDGYGDLYYFTLNSSGVSQGDPVKIHDLNPYAAFSATTQFNDVVEVGTNGIFHIFSEEYNDQTWAGPVGALESLISDLAWATAACRFGNGDVLVAYSSDNETEPSQSTFYEIYSGGEFSGPTLLGTELPSDQLDCVTLNDGNVAILYTDDFGNGRYDTGKIKVIGSDGSIILDEELWLAEGGHTIQHHWDSEFDAAVINGGTYDGDIFIAYKNLEDLKFYYKIIDPSDGSILKAPVDTILNIASSSSAAIDVVALPGGRVVISNEINNLIVYIDDLSE